MFPIQETSRVSEMFTKALLGNEAQWLELCTEIVKFIASLEVTGRV